MASLLKFYNSVGVEKMQNTRQHVIVSISLYVICNLWLLCVWWGRRIIVHQISCVLSMYAIRRV